MNLTVFAICLMAALSTNAQYRKMTRGERVPFDTAVVTELNQFRIEGYYIKRSKILIDSLNLEGRALTREVDSLYAEINYKNLHIRNDSVKFQTLAGSYESLSGDVNKLSQQFDKLSEQKKGKWTFKDWLLLSLVIYVGGRLTF